MPRPYVDTVGKNTKAIKEYIGDQLKRDHESDQLSMYDPKDPFTGSKQQMHGWQANKKRTCAQPVVFRAMPENEKPPAMRADSYCIRKPRHSGGVPFWLLPMHIDRKTPIVLNQ